MIEFRSVNYHYKPGRTGFSLRDINLVLEKESVTIFFGKNGSGKSTLVQLLAGLGEPRSGYIAWNGKPIVASERLKRIALILQNPTEQFLSLTVEKEIAFTMENLGFSQKTMQEKIKNALYEFDLVHLKNRPASELSGGELLKVMLAAATAIPRDCYIFDEPTSILDQREKMYFWKNIKELKNKGKIVVVLTQFASETLMADSLVVLNEGQVVFNGSPNDFWNHKEIWEKYTKIPPLECYRFF
jgi:energy-coupling factor transport system ATP-binding protein